MLYSASHTTQKFRSSLFKGLQGAGTASLLGVGGAGVRWTPLPKAEAPTEPIGETQSPKNKELKLAERCGMIGLYRSGAVPLSGKGDLE